MYEIPRTTVEYWIGVEEFIKSAERFKENKGEDSIVCPCRDCKNLFQYYNSEEVKNHLIRRGFVERYTVWAWHGESHGETSTARTNLVEEDISEFIDDENDIESRDCDVEGRDSDVENEIGNDNFDDMFCDVENENINDENDAYNKFAELKNDCQLPLFPGCKTFTKLSAVLNLYNLKANNGWSDKSFTALLQLLGEMLPDKNELPKSCYQAKKLMCPMGMEVEKIHACPNDCILYRKEYQDLHECPKCGASRFKVKKNKTKDGSEKTGPPTKVVWYFPIITRFRRLFANPKDAKYLRWHAEDRIKDGKLRHPADSPQWRNIDSSFPTFGCEPRNLKLGLSTDGMNPFGNMSSRHSTWPVLLCIYNLPPWLTMKRKYIMMSLLISGPKQPENDIDVYLAPLIEDLQKLWSEGVIVYDAYKKENFKLHAMIFCTINDFPAFGNLSGYSTKGGKACPTCEDDTVDMWLPNSRKTVYMGHRRFLPSNHQYRKQKKSFNGAREHGIARFPLTGEEIYARVKDIVIEFGKCSKNTPNPKNTWKKRSIFWDLPYWKELQVRHCIDVMHVEKNVCDSLIGLLLNIKGKTKDGINARKDMVEMEIRPRLAPVERDDKRTYLPPACYTLSRKEKTSFCQCLHSVKVPSGYSSNIKRFVSIKDLKLIGMKSHDCHVLMTHMIPVAIRGILPKDVRHTITKLCFFFNAINLKVIDPDMLDKLQGEVVVTLCQLEKYFPPSFFDIMVHLIVHLVQEIKMCGPVFLRYMYPFERFMGILKKYVRNRHRPEGSIVEGYVAEEVIEFCTEYMTGVEPIGIPRPKHEGRLRGVGTIGFKAIMPEIALLEKAHLVILQHSADVQPLAQEHLKLIREQNPKKGPRWVDDEHNQKFVEWIKTRVSGPGNPADVNETVQWLAQGPAPVVRSYQGYDINGYTFYTKKQDEKSTNANSGVTLVAWSKEFSKSNDSRPIDSSMSYYGFIEDIWELDYYVLSIPLFRCKWIDNRHGVKNDKDYGFTLVNPEKLGYVNDPFILAKQAHQIFYVLDPADSKGKWHIVLHGKRRIVGIEDVVDEEEYDHFDEIPPFSIGVQHAQDGNDEIDGANYMRADHEEGLIVPNDNRS